MAGPSVSAAEIANACVSDATAVLTDTYSEDTVVPDLSLIHI